LIFFALGFRRRALRHGASRDCSETHFPIPPVTRGNSIKSCIAGDLGENPENRARDKIPPTWRQRSHFVVERANEVKTRTAPTP
jgi:hypothetical protein